MIEFLISTIAIWVLFLIVLWALGLAAALLDYFKDKEGK